MKTDYTALYRRLNYTFQQNTLLVRALTHRSADTSNNERLEFLGDALLNYLMADVLYHRFPQAKEGELTRLRADLVKGETLTAIAHYLELGQYLRLGGGELKSGGWRRASILADAMEAMIGAIYLDAGMAVCQQVVLNLWENRLAKLSPAEVIKDPKTRLQEYLQARQQALPAYELLSVEGEPHAQQFTVKCQVTGLNHATYGVGDSRRRAEQAAAQQALDALLHEK